MGGSLTLEESKVTSGSTFLLTLPVSTQQSVAICGIDTKYSKIITNEFRKIGWICILVEKENIHNFENQFLIINKDDFPIVELKTASYSKIILLNFSNIFDQEDLFLKYNGKVCTINWSDSTPERIRDDFTQEYENIKNSLEAVGSSSTVAPDKLSTLHNKHILIVDDDPRNIFALKLVLEDVGIKVATAKNGEECINFLRNKKVDLIFMDIMMPVMDGIETLTYLRNNMNLKSLPIIALTAKAMAEDKAQCLEAGATDYLSKPLDIEIVYSTIEKWLQDERKE